MGQFMGTHQNRVDAKGRVSVPAPFRAVLRAAAIEGEPALILRRSHAYPCIEGWPATTFAGLAQGLAGLDLFSEAHDDMAAVLYAESQAVECDREGRIVLPEALAGHAGITDTVAFMGLGRYFQIWNEKAAAERRAQAFARVRERQQALPATGAA
jgi:MraZ protein